HNEVRQQWANGEGNVALKACRMPTMRWHAELAKLAELHIKSCQMRHDECRNTQEFDASGQNLYLTGTTSKQPRDVSSLLREAV
ncbi:antigen 5 like allergen Cul n 1, partial [Drosophila busckii]